MIITATDLKNNLGKYLRTVEREDVYITSNGRKVAKLYACRDQLTVGIANEIIMESAEASPVPSRKVTYEEFLEISENSEERYE